MTNPTAQLSVRKSLVKKYDNNTYYLPSGTEFEIELLNTTNDTICAQLTINGKTEDSALVLKPGQRFFLDRFMDENNKFKFDTYEVDGNNSDVQKAIANNGDVTVRFFKKVYSKPPKKNIFSQDWYKRDNLLRSKGVDNIGPFTSTGGYVHITKSDDVLGRSVGSNNCFYSSNVTLDSGTGTFNTTNTLNNLSNSANISFNLSDNQIGQSIDFVDTIKNISATVETGRIESGSKSVQDFVESDDKFSQFAFAQTSFKILPISQKPADQEVAIYCSQCGRKVKTTEHFCPKCGNNLDEQRKNM